MMWCRLIIEPLILELAAEILAGQFNNILIKDHSPKGELISVWNACSDVELNNYASILNNLLESVPMLPVCCLQNCCIQQHRCDIDNYLISFCFCIYDAS